MKILSQKEYDKRIIEILPIFLLYMMVSILFGIIIGVLLK